MKNIIIISISILVFAFTNINTSITLQEALTKNLVSVEIKSLGKYQGESAVMEIKNLTKNDLLITVEPGRKLIAEEDKYQNLLIVQQQQLLVTANSKKKHTVIGFCCESTDSGPKVNLGYKPNKMADSNLVKLAQFINLNYKQLNTTCVQQSIWAISNNHATAALSVTSEKEMSLKKLVSSLKNEPIPWYEIVQRIQQTPNGMIHIMNDSLYGKMNYSNDSWCYSKLNVYDSKNEGILISIGNWLKPGSNNSYDVALQIKHLPKGKYKITLENEKQIFTQKDVQI